MATDRTLLPADVVINAYLRNHGNKTAAAEELGIHRDTLRGLLKLYKADSLPVTGGRIEPLKHNVLPLPPEGVVYRYIISSAQNNTWVHKKFIKNLEAYAKWLERDGDTCRIMIARFAYNKNRYVNKKSQKPGTVTDATKHADLEDLWYDPLIIPYVVDDPEVHGSCRWVMAPGLHFAAELNIEATATKPLSELGTYTAGADSIFPATKVAMESIAVTSGQESKLIYSTGVLTGRNYVQKKAGLKAEFHHSYNALLVEVDHTGSHWVRHLGTSKGDFYDIPRGEPIRVMNGEVTTGHRVEAINWGDTHCEELPQERINTYWIGTPLYPAVIDCLRPKYQFHNDLMSFRARSPHETDNFEARLRKFINGQDDVTKDFEAALNVLSEGDREFCTTVVVRSNHCNHAEKWLDKCDFRHDLENVELFLKAQLSRVQTIKAGGQWMFTEWMLKQMGCNEAVRFLKEDEDFFICQKTHPINCGLHGHLGVNGSKGTTSGLAAVGAKLNVGHSHSPKIQDGVWCAGVSAPEQNYKKGPSSWKILHVLTYLSGKRSTIVEKNNKLWA